MQLTQGLRWCQSVVPAKTSTIDGDRTRTWAETGDRVARLAAGLRRLGVQRGSRVIVLALNSDRYAEALYAIAWAGAVSVPFNTRWAKAEVIDAATDSAPSLVMVDAHFAPFASDFAAGGLDVVLIDGDGGDRSLEMLVASESPMADGCGRGDDLASIFFTGGTTGRNKGVMLSHVNLVSSFLMLHARAPYAEDTRFLYTPPLFHLAAATSLFGITAVGGANIFLPGFEPMRTLRAIEQHRISAMVLVPTMIGTLCETLRTVEADVSSIVRLSYGASAISPALLERAMRTFPNAEFVQGYGQTELSPALTLLDHADHLAGRLSSAGRPLPLAEVRIVDGDMAPLPAGEVGEVVARGPNVMAGYWRLPDLTAETIVDGWLRTGDVGYLDADGYLYLVDRVKDMIVSGGENIYSAEVEHVLMRHAGVLQCAAIGVPDPQWGERVHAIVVMREGSPASEDELASHCRNLMAGYKCPKSFEFRTSQLPLSGVGKVLKTELRKPYWENSRRNIG